MILGSAGSGKSTLAKIIGQLTNIPVIHLDCFYWQPNWVARDYAEMELLVKNSVAKEEWIIDGNYFRTIDLRINKADSIIFIDFNRFLCLYRVIKRRLKYRNKVREDIGEGCKEKIDKEFLSYVWNYKKLCRKRILNSTIIKNLKQNRSFS